MKLRFPPGLATVLAVIQFVAGCGPGRYPKSYVLTFPPVPTSPAPLPDVRGALAVREFQCPNYLCEGRIVYRPSAEEIGFYEFDRWAMNPRDMVTRFVADRIRSEAIFKSVSLTEVGTEPTYVLNGNIERLEEVDNGREVHAVCTLSVQLMDKQTKSVIWSRTASGTVAVQTRSVAGVVSSLSTAVRMTVDEIVTTLMEALPSAGTAMTHPVVTQFEKKEQFCCSKR